MRIYLITHAHTEQVPHVAADVWRLSDRGNEQAAALAGAPFWAQVDRVVVSAEPKTLLTVAGVVERRKIPVWVDSRFDELRRSGWIEDYAAQVEQVFAQPERSISGWEAAASVRMRVQSGLADLKRRFAGERMALVGHGICLSLLRAGLLGLPTADLSHWRRLAFGSYAYVCLDPPAILQDFAQSADVTR
ncbi:MAG: histidine phosphatase family protein [Caldilineaceae bacterium]|nr:histidine phosphatase family protein [Caldilineaceae bacterium]